MMRRWRQFPQIGGKRGGGIPSGWVEVEYIETKGAQWIETGVAPSLDMKLECGIYFTVMVDEYFCSCRINTGNTRYYLININATYGLVTTKSLWPGASVKLPSEFVSTKHDVVATIGRDSVSIEVDGTKKEFQDSVAVISSKTLPLFGGKLNDSDVVNAFSRAGTRCYYARFTSFGSVVRDLVPVRNATTNEGAMCDVLTGDIYRNQGTGAFVVGPDKRQYTARDYVQDGLLALWDGIENAGFGLHDSSAVSWKDLSGNGRDFANIVTGANSWSDTHLNVAQNTRVVQSWSISGIKTIEVCGYAENNAWLLFSFGSGRRLFSILPTNSRGFQFGSGAPSMFQPFNTDWTATATFDGEDDYPAHTYYKGEEKPHTAGTSSWAVSGNAWIPSPANYPFRGKVRCIRIYDRALTSAEVAANFAVDRTRFNIA